MIDPSVVQGKRLAVVLIGVDSEENPEGAVFFGVGRWDGKSLRLDRGKEHPPFTIPNSALRRLQEVSKELKKTLEGADYWLSLTVGPIPEGEDLSKYIPTGLKWPK